MYRGLWVVDGNFILEAARYLGYDRGPAGSGNHLGPRRKKAASSRAGAATLERHRDRHVYAGSPGRTEAGLELLPRDAAEPAARVESLRGCGGRGVGSATGRYGLLAEASARRPGRGPLGVHQTLWVPAGLQGGRQRGRRLGSRTRARWPFHGTAGSLLDAARQEMRQHPAGSSTCRC